MPIYFGSNKIKDLYFGGQKIKEVYYGSTKVYSSVVMVTLTVNPTYSSASVVLSAPGYSQSGKTITVPAGTTVSVTLSANRCETRTFPEIVNETKTITPQIMLSKIAPSATYNAGASYQINTWSDRGQCIVAGTYTYTRGTSTNTWKVTVNTKGEVQTFSASGSISQRTASTTPVTITPTGGWKYSDIWV